MINLNNYLPVDHEEVNKQDHCIELCLNRARLNVDDGNLHQAQVALEDAIKSIKELKNLQYDKEERDKMNRLNHLHTQQIVPVNVINIFKKK